MLHETPINIATNLLIKINEIIELIHTGDDKVKERTTELRFNQNSLHIILSTCLRKPLKHLVYRLANHLAYESKVL